MMKAALAGVATRFHRKLASYVASKGAAKAEMGNESVWRRGVSVPKKPFPHIPQAPALTPPQGHPPQPPSEAEWPQHVG